MNISKDSAFYRFAAWQKHPSLEIKDGCTLYLAAVGSILTIVGSVILAVSSVLLAGVFAHYLRGIDTDTTLASPVNVVVHGLVFLAVAGATGYGLFRLGRKHCQSIKIV